ncbi:peptidase M28, partial [Usnea florida]
KASPHGFIGATDSDAPCAILLHVAQSIDTLLSKKWSSAESKAGSPGSSKGDPVVGLQILFLDGEEMFGNWTGTETNVLYGSRSLAAEWERTECPPHSVNRNRLESISLFVLPDLLGAKDPKIPSYLKTTHWAYARMAHLEARLRHQGLFKSLLSDVTKGRNSAESTWFFESEKNESDSWVERRIIDDHLPFIDRDVEVLHIIPEPFPSVWHTVNDNGKHLDINTVGDWASLITAFVAEWMVSQGFIVYDEG